VVTAGSSGLARSRRNASPPDALKPIGFAIEQDFPSDVVPHAVCPESARRLWEVSERLLSA
jgi:hypothetical protein